MSDAGVIWRNTLCSQPQGIMGNSRADHKKQELAVFSGPGYLAQTQDPTFPERPLCSCPARAWSASGLLGGLMSRQ